MIQTTIRHSKRYQVIINTFVKNGLSHFLYRIGLTKNKKLLQEDDNQLFDANLVHLGEKLCNSLQTLGPTFIKLGQIASTRRDIVPAAIAKELEKLQDDVEQFSYKEVEEIFLHELSKTPHELYEHFNETPLATASIGQVHTATTLSGEKVAVKVQRPHIKETMEVDLDILFHIARLIEDRTKWGKTYRIVEVIEDFSNSLKNELNYLKEGRNADKISEQFVHDETIHIPKIHWDVTTSKILTMEMIHGVKVTNLDKLQEAGYDKHIIADRIAHSLFSQVLEYGFFHGDPHPGNIYILPNNVICYLDFGMVGKLNKQLQYHFASLLLAVEDSNAKEMIHVFQEMDLLDQVEKVNLLERDLELLFEKYELFTISDISLGQLLIDIFTIAYKHQVEIPTDITILAKAILTAEEVIETLNPKFNVMKAIEPFGIKIIQERFNPKYLLKRVFQDAVDDIDTLRQLPDDIHRVTETINKGRLKVHHHLDEGPNFLKRLDRISNRLSFSIILLSFSILMVGLIIGASIAGETNLLFQLPLIELGGIVALIMFLFMLFAIFRSGRM